MFDCSARLEDRGTARRGQRTAVDDALHTMGFRDCAREAVRFLTETARLDPDSAVVQDVRRLLVEGPTATGPNAGFDVSSDPSVNVRRVRRTIAGRSAKEDLRENRSVTTLRRRSHIRRRRQHRVGRSHCARTSTSVTDRGPADSTSASLVDGVSATDDVGLLMVDGERGRRQRHPLTTLQTASTSSSASTPTSSNDVPCVRSSDHLTTSGDVIDCASTLVKLSRTDARVRNVLSELMQLMDDDDDKHT